MNFEEKRRFDPKVFVSCIKKETKYTQLFMTIKESMTYSLPVLLICQDGKTEQVASLLKKKGQPLREEVSRCLRNFAMLKHTFNKEEYSALKCLRCDDSIVILTAEKGNSTVVLDGEVYNQKMLDLLSSTDYIQLKKDPTTHITTQLKNYLSVLDKQNCLPFDLKRRLTP